jgi:hypothetical protein
MGEIFAFLWADLSTAELILLLPHASTLRLERGSSEETVSRTEGVGLTNAAPLLLDREEEGRWPQGSCVWGEKRWRRSQKKEYCPQASKVSRRFARTKAAARQEVLPRYQEKPRQDKTIIVAVLVLSWYLARRLGKTCSRWNCHFETNR